MNIEIQRDELVIVLKKDGTLKELFFPETRDDEEMPSNIHRIMEILLEKKIVDNEDM